MISRLWPETWLSMEQILRHTTLGTGSRKSVEAVRVEKIVVLGWRANAWQCEDGRWGRRWSGLMKTA